MAISKNPYSGTDLFTFAELSARDLQDRLQLAGQAFNSWKFRPLNERCQKLQKVATVLRAQKAGLARTITLEMGKPISQAEAEIEKCAWLCEYYAEQAPAQLREEHFQTDAALSYVRFDPLGVILGVMP